MKRTISFTLMLLVLILPFCRVTLSLNDFNSINNLDGPQSAFRLQQDPPALPLQIRNNQDFVDMGLPGAGTQNNPYVLEGLDIVGNDEVAIEVWNTDVYFVIRNCQITTTNVTAIIFLNVSHGKISSLEITGGGITFEQSSNLEIDDCRITNSDDTGIFVFYSNSTKISYNQVTNNTGHGVHLHRSSYCTLTNNTLDENYTGISIYSSLNCTIVDNTFQYNRGFGVYFSGDSLYNVFYRNIFGWNEISHVGSDPLGHSTLNYWDDGVSQGNSWSDYYGIGTYDAGASHRVRNDIDHYPSCIGICPFAIHTTILLAASVVILFIASLYLKKRLVH